MFRRTTLNLLLTTLAIGLLLWPDQTVSACPSCQAALAAHDPQSANLVKGYYYSILFMMGMPFALLSAFSVSMYRAVKRAEREQQNLEPCSEPESPLCGPY